METIPLFEELSLGAVPDTNRLSGLAIARLVDTKRLFLWQKEIRDAITSIRQAETVDEFRDEVRRQSTDLRSRFEAVERSLAAERHKGLMKTVFTATGGAVGAGVGLTHLNPLLIIAGAAAGAGLADRMVRAVDRDDKSVDSAIRPIVVEMNR
jgi:pyruvate/2-oxoglutarate dehydrogenase complex dihydrolipoamide dehydrogenase (E3) component